MNILIDSIQIIHIGYIIDIISSICIFYSLFISYIKDVNNKNSEISAKIANSSIKIKEKEQKIVNNKNITQTINDNLNKKQRLLEIIIGQYNKCVVVIDRAGYIINEDDSFLKMWNEYKEYKYKLNLSLFLNNSIKNQSEFLTCINKVSESGEQVESEFEGKDGRYFNCIYSPFTISYKNMGIICYIEDITYKKKSEIKIEENNAKYKTIVENIPYSIVLAEENRIVYDNKKYDDINLNKEDIESIVFNNAMNEDAYYTNCLNNTVCLNIDRVNFNNEGDKKNLVAIRNITPYKQLLENVNYSKEKYEKLVNVIPEGICILDYENNLPVYANSALFKITNTEKLEDINLNIINEGIVMTSNNNENIKFKRKVIINKPGKYTHIECGGTIINVNKRLKLVGVVRDITEQVETELIEIEIEKKKIENKNKSEFFINISHELKTPLNIISSSNQLLEILCKDEILKNPNSEISKSILDVKKYSYMVMGLVNNMMDLAKLESDFHQSKRDYYNIVNIVEDITVELSKYIVDDSIEMVFDTDEEEKISNVDPDDIEKVVLTILSMAIRYSKSGSLINIELKNKGNKDIIEITNEGFYDHNSYINDLERRNIDIGIEVAKQIMELYNGRIDIKIGSSGDLHISIQVQIDKNRENYKDRMKAKVDDLAYSEYIRMCNF
ncbi:histidine kinase dimerization/phospho-acceptor domain-containing protein [Romboutsia sp.]|uniref:histidine kinase dimerization/phospho-acceptor domain-containing protein n=1 Tax=Romboutsia sp. TaxID=1965302 RepID=UPI003F66A70D